MIVVFLLCLTCSSLIGRYSSTINAPNCLGSICFFRFFSLSENYSRASAFCREYNKTLAFLPNRTAQSFLQNYFVDSGRNQPPYYVGLRYIANETFAWDSGDNVVPQLNWANDSIINGSESCAFIANGLVKVSWCGQKLPFMCSNDSSNITSNEKPKGNVTCPADFFRYRGRCYKMNLKCNDETVTWKDAQAKCKGLSPNSSVMIVNSMIDQEFLTALMTKSPQASWMGLGHINVTKVFSIWATPDNRMPLYPINFKVNEPNNAHHESCLMVYHRLTDIGRMNDENCSKYLNYICESPMIEGNSNKETPNPLFAQGQCKAGYYEFNETCYRVSKQPQTYLEANKSSLGKLVFTHSYIDVAYIRSLMAYEDIPAAWISITHNTSNGAEVASGTITLLKELGQSQKDLDTNSCYFIRTSSKGLFKANCSEMNQYLDYYYLDGHERNGDNLTCPLEWDRVGKKCFQVKKRSMNFKDAETNCKLFNGKLATFQNMKESQKVSSLETSLDALWIGLNGTSFLKQSWIDGTPLNYCQFRHTKNMLDVVQKNPNQCFAVRSHKLEWTVKDCSDIYNYVCEQPATETRCLKSFSYNIDGNCFGIFDNEMTWSDAEKHCQLIGGPEAHLASFHDDEQELSLFRQIKKEGSYWIGLHAINYMKQWVDGTVLNYEHYLSASKDPLYFNCFAYNHSKNQAKSWSKENCAIKMPFVCEISNNITVKPPPKPPVIKKHFYCPKGFIKHGLYCFKLFNESVQWTEADKLCQALFASPHPQYPVARLARFDNIVEYASVLSSLRDSVGQVIWIGLYEDPRTKQLVWIDEKPLNITKSLHNASIVPENKVAMEVSWNPVLNGRWAMYPDLKNFPYICRTDPHETYDAKFDNPDITPYTSLTHANCSNSFVSYNGQCYFYNKELLTFQEAEAFCRKNGANLLVVENTFEENFIKSLYDTQHVSWMGLKVESPNFLRNWVTTNKASLYYTHWMHLEDFKETYPDHIPHAIVKGCYAIKMDGDVDGGMTRFDCSVKYPSICKASMTSRNPDKPQQISCTKSSNGTLYDLDVMNTIDKTVCVRWDIVYQKDPQLYHQQTHLFSSFPFHPDGYLSFSLERCSEIKYGNGTVHEYSCYIYENKQYTLKPCQMVPCKNSMMDTSSRSNHSFAIIMAVIVVFVAMVILLYIYRKDLLSTYRVRVVLARVLGRYQPDWLRDSHTRTQASSMGGTGFANPIYTPLETRY